MFKRLIMCDFLQDYFLFFKFSFIVKKKSKMSQDFRLFFLEHFTFKSTVLFKEFNFSYFNFIVKKH